MGSNPIADTVFSRIRWVQLLKAQRKEKVSLVTQNIPGECLSTSGEVVK